MTVALRCGECGALAAPFGRGHWRSCSAYVPPAINRHCPLCGEAARVDDVDVANSHVIWRCSKCREVWTDTYAAAVDDEDDLADEEVTA